MCALPCSEPWVPLDFRSRILRCLCAIDCILETHCPFAFKCCHDLLQPFKIHHAAAPWHFLYFLPDPQGHGSLRPTFASCRLTVRASGWPPEKYIGCCFGFGGGSERCTRLCSCSCSCWTTTSIFHRYFTTRS